MYGICAYDPNFSNTTLPSLTSIAYNSSVLWSHVKDGSTGQTLSFWAIFKIVISDISGAIGGYSAGKELAKDLNINETVGGVVGAVVGGVAASAGVA